MSTFKAFHLRQLRRQPLRTILAAIALASAVGVTVTSMVVATSIDHSTEELLRALGGPAPLRVIGPLTRAGVSPATVDRVEATEGVAAAVPVVQGVVIAENEAGYSRSVLALGVDCRSEALFGEFGCETELVDRASDEPVLMSTALADDLGPDGYLRTDVGRVAPGDAVRNDRLNDTNGGGVVFFELSVAQRVLDRGDNVDAVYVKPGEGVDVEQLRARLVSTVGEQNQVLLKHEPAAWLVSRGPLLVLLGLVVLVGVGLSILLVYNVVSLSLAERRRDLAIMSAVGISPRTLVRNVLAESAVLGLIGGVFGDIAGVVLASPIVRSIASVVTEQASGMRVETYAPLRVHLIGLVVGAATAVIAAVIPARRASRIDLSAELHGRGSTQEVQPMRTLRRIAALAAIVTFGVVASYVAQRNGAIERWQPPLGALALVAAAFASFALAGAVAPMLLSLVLGRLRTRGGPSRVSLANLVAQPRRTSVIAAAVASAVGMGCVLGALVPAIKGAVATFDGGTIGNSVFVTTLPLNNSSNIDARLPAADLERLRRMEGVARVDETRCSEVSDSAGSSYALCGIDLAHVTSPVILGDQIDAVFARGEAAVATGAARERGLRPGDVLRVATPTGMRPVRVGAVWINANNNGYSVFVPLAKHEELMGPVTPHNVRVSPTPDVTVHELATRIRRSGIADIDVQEPRDLVTAMADEVALQVEPFWLMQRMLLFVALVGTLSTLLLIGVQRRRELGILGSVGFSPGALGRMTLFEAVAAGGVGGLLGAVASVASFETLRNAAATTVGARPPFEFSAGSAVSSIALAVVVVAIGGAWPAWRTSRLQIVEAIRDE